MTELYFKEESYKIVGACFEVHKMLGHGFKEIVYKDALEIELQSREIPFIREKPFSIVYKEQELKHLYVADFVIYGTIILEIKIGAYIGSPYIKQTMNYFEGLRFKTWNSG